MKIINEKTVEYEIEDLEKMVARTLRNRFKAYDTLSVEQKQCIVSIIGEHYTNEVNEQIKNKKIEIILMNYDAIENGLKEFVDFNKEQINGLIKTVRESFESLYSAYLSSIGFDVVEVEETKAKYLESTVFTAGFKDSASRVMEFIEVLLVYVNGDVVPFLNPTIKRFSRNDSVIVPIGSGFELTRSVKGTVLHSFIVPVSQVNGLAVVGVKNLEDIESLSLRVVIGFFDGQTKEPVFFKLKQSTSNTILH